MRSSQMDDLKTYEGVERMARGCLFFLEPRGMTLSALASPPQKLGLKKAEVACPTS